MRKTITVVLTLIFLLTFAVPGFADTDMNIQFPVGKNVYIVNGVKNSMDAKTFIENGRTYVPVRYLALATGVAEDKIIWSPSANTVTLIKDDVTVTLAIGGNVIYVNDEPRQMDVTPLIRNGRTYLPARWVAGAFGYKVDWDGKTRTVIINDGEVQNDDYSDAPANTTNVEEIRDGGGGTNTTPPSNSLDEIEPVQ
ncbi:MAG: copper amine oxidase N-terminal domain-containing protein [Peptococcaceae bacterium]|nr:copper amine oxidase N-terminal domain-containing protein [Peptococcaceae bacterium]